MEDAILFIEDLKEKLRAQGNQVITYRRKLRQQVSSALASQGWTLSSDLEVGCVYKYPEHHQSNATTREVQGEMGSTNSLCASRLRSSFFRRQFDPMPETFSLKGKTLLPFKLDPKALPNFFFFGREWGRNARLDPGFHGHEKLRSDDAIMHINRWCIFKFCLQFHITFTSPCVRSSSVSEWCCACGNRGRTEMTELGRTGVLQIQQCIWYGLSQSSIHSHLAFFLPCHEDLDWKWGPICCGILFVWLVCRFAIRSCSFVFQWDCENAYEFTSNQEGRGWIFESCLTLILGWFDLLFRK